jgi:hypothetical protein
MYLVKSPDTVALIHRHSRTLRFLDVAILQVTGTMGFTRDTWDKLNPTADEDQPVSRATHKGHHANMVPSKIHDMHDRSFDVIANRLNGMALTEPEVMQVRPWLRNMMTVAAAAAMYGEDNPIVWDPSLIEDMKWASHLP